MALKSRWRRKKRKPCTTAGVPVVVVTEKCEKKGKKKKEKEREQRIGIPLHSWIIKIFKHLLRERTGTVYSSPPPHFRPHARVKTWFYAQSFHIL